MESAVLVWALWVGAGGKVQSGYLIQPYVSAYFPTKEECVRVQKYVNEWARWSQCIQGKYVIQGISK